MAAGDPIIDLSDMVYLATGGAGGSPDQVNFHKTGLRVGVAPTAPVAGRIHSLWAWDGQPGGSGGTAPTTSAALNNATAGSWGQLSVGATGRRKYLLGIAVTCLVAGSLIIYDRLVHQGGLLGSATGANTTNLPTTALPRRTTGKGVEPWLEAYVALGTTSRTITASYTNSGGTTGRTSVATTLGIAGLQEVDRIIPLAIASGDVGVRAVASTTLSAALASGTFGITLSYPLAILPMGLAGVGTLWSSFLQPNGPLDLEANGAPCLALAWMANTTTIPVVKGSAYFMEK